MKNTSLLIVVIAGALSSQVQAAPVYKVIGIDDSTAFSPRTVGANGNTILNIPNPNLSVWKHAAITNAGIVTDLGTIAEPHSEATSISPSGEWVTGFSTYHVPGITDLYRAFTWTGSEGMKRLAELPATESSFGRVVNDHGDVLGDSTILGSFGGPVLTATLWKDGQAFDLNSTVSGFDGFLQGGVAFLADGKLVAWGLNSTATERHNYILQPVPLPAGVWLLGSAIAGMGIFRRKQA